MWQNRDTMTATFHTNQITRRSIPAFYLMGCIREIIPIYPLYAVMFTEQGITPLELSALFITWSSVGILLEIPSGTLADRFSRKWLIVSSSGFKSAAFFTWYLWPDFYGYGLGFILWGVGSTLRSGAWEALLYDLLATIDRQGEFTRHYGRISALSTIGVMLGEACGGFLIVHGYSVVLLVSAAIPLIAAIPFALLVRDVPRKESASEASYTQLFQSGLKEVVVSPNIRYLVLVVGLLLVTFGVYDEYSGVLLLEKDYSLAMIAFLGIPIFFAQAIGQALAPRFERFSQRQILTLIAASALLLVTLPFTGIHWAPVALSIYFFTFGVSATLFQGYLQNAIEGEARATVTSFAGFADGVGAIIWYLIFGAMAEVHGVVMASLGLGLLAALLCGFFSLLASHWYKQTST